MIQRTCSISGQTFQITSREVDFYKKRNIPLPTLCPQERMRQKMTFRNEWNFFRRDCSATGKKIIAMYPQETSFPVYEQAYWWGDLWDARTYGRDYDFSRPFFDQFAELLKVVPRIAIINANSENAQYTNYSHRNKNCYIGVGLGFCEDCIYNFRCFRCKDITDCLFMLDCQWCYECSECEKLYECTFCHQCTNGHDLKYCFDCRGCHNCFGCWNLNHKSYHIFNEAYSKEDYEKKLKTLSGADRQKAFDYIKSKAVFRGSKQLNCENCTGDNLVECKNCFSSFDGYESEDCSYILFGGGDKDCLDVMYCDNNELTFQSACLEKNYDVGFSFLIWYCQQMRYCMECFNSENCFGCLSLNKSKYCILNKQHTKDQYESLMPKIIEHMKSTGEWGTYFPSHLSPFAYNQTIAQIHYPLSSDEAKSKDYRWETSETASKYIGEKYEIPHNIQDVPDDIIDKILTCGETGKHFKIQKAELQFYRKMDLPIPHIHPDIRYQKRMHMRNPRTLWDRQCTQCQKDIQTTYAPERPEKILCEDCYLKTIN